MSEAPDRDRELDAFLERNSALQRRWRDQQRDEPPASLDASLRAAARESVSSKPRSPASFASRWRVPLSIAAIVVVSTTVTVMVAEERAHLPDASLERAPAASSSQPPHEAPPAEVEPQTSEALRMAPASVRDPSKADEAAPAKSKRERARDPGRADTSSHKREAAPQPGAPSVVAPAAGAPQAAGSAEHRAAPPAAQEPVFVPEPPATPTGTLRDEVRAQEAPARAAAPVQPRTARELDEAPPAPAADAQAERAPTERARLEQVAPAAKTVQGTDGDIAAEVEPQRWIERIRALRAAGKLQEAEESLREFRKRYPEFRLPPDLDPGR